MENQGKKTAINSKISGRGNETTEMTEANEDGPEIGNGLLKNPNLNLAYADKESFSSMNFPTNTYRSSGPAQLGQFPPENNQQSITSYQHQDSRNFQSRQLPPPTFSN